MIRTIIVTFHNETPKIYLQIAAVMMLVSGFHGLPQITFLLGGSVARAKAAKVSIIRFNHKSYTADNGDSERIHEPIATVSIAEILHVT